MHSARLLKTHARPERRSLQVLQQNDRTKCALGALSWMSSKTQAWFSSFLGRDVSCLGSLYLLRPASWQAQRMQAAGSLGGGRDSLAQNLQRSVFAGERTFEAVWPSSLNTGLRQQHDTERILLTSSWPFQQCRTELQHLGPQQTEPKPSHLTSTSRGGRWGWVGSVAGGR